MNQSEFGPVLERLSRVPGVRGALIADTDAGVPVVAELEADVDGGALAALGVSLFRRAARAADSAGFGELGALQLESEAGHVVAAGAGALSVVVLTDATSQLGQVRLQVQRAAESLP